MTAKRRLVKKLFEGYFNNEQDDILIRIISEKYKCHGVLADNLGTGPLAVHKILEIHKTVLPSLKYEITRQTESGNIVVTEWIAQGRYEGRFHGSRPTNQLVKISGTIVFRFAQEKIIESWGGWAFESLSQKLGISVKNLLNCGKKINEVAIRAEGQGEPILFTSTLFLKGWRLWAYQKNFFKKKYLVINHDLIGIRHSIIESHPTSTYSCMTEVNSLHSAIRAADIKFPIHVVGFSAGCNYALSFALKYPHKVKTLTMIEPSCPGIFGAYANWPGEVKEFVDKLRHIMNQKISVKNLIKMHKHYKYQPEAMQSNADSWDCVLIYARKTIELRKQLFALKFDERKLRNLKIPVLLIKGDRSPAYYHKIVERFGNLLPNSKTVEMPGYHGPHLYSGTARFMKIFNRFLKESK
jgi:pimeloyl-ACP methyl ester carboxylesterase/predicted ester cyclase